MNNIVGDQINDVNVSYDPYDIICFLQYGARCQRDYELIELNLLHVSDDQSRAKFNSRCDVAFGVIDCR